MKTIKGPALFLAQFAADQPPYNSLPTLAKWAAEKGFKGVQIPAGDSRLIDMKQAAESDTYCDELKGVLADRGLALTELPRTSQGNIATLENVTADAEEDLPLENERFSPFTNATTAA